MTTSEVLKELERLEYRDGTLYWLKPNSNRLKVGQRFGSSSGANGYRKGTLSTQRFYEHHLVFALHHGYLPKYIDHIDGNRSNNRIENLREATSGQNSMNARLRKDNPTGHKNVTIAKGKYKVRLRANGVVHSLGVYTDFETACSVAEEARARYHGEYARSK